MGKGRSHETPAKAEGRTSLKELALATALERTEQRWGKGAIVRLEQAPTALDSLPTGILALDRAIGIGGLPKGRPIELYGAESCGKTTVALEMMAATQRQGGHCAFIDAEQGFDPRYAQSLGIHLGDLILSQPRSGEEGLDIVVELVHTGAVDLIVVDSVAALAPRTELEGLEGDEHTGAHARMMSQAMRRLMTALGKSKSVVVFINQVRENLANRHWGLPTETTTGGRALKFYASVRIELRRTELLKAGGSVCGHVVRARIVKNKVAPPFREAEFEIHFGRGVCKESDLLAQGLGFGLVTRHGAWFAYGGKPLGQGREAARSFLANNPAVRERLEGHLRDKLKGDAASPLDGRSVPGTTQD